MRLLLLLQPRAVTKQVSLEACKRWLEGAGCEL